MATTYYKITEKELLALVATAESCHGMAAGDHDEIFEQEAEEAMQAIRQIEKRNGIAIQSDFSKDDTSSVPMIDFNN